MPVRRISWHRDVADDELRDRKTGCCFPAMGDRHDCSSVDLVDRLLRYEPKSTGSQGQNPPTFFPESNALPSGLRTPRSFGRGMLFVRPEGQFLSSAILGTLLPVCSTSTVARTCSRW